jgi:hypothetical protein
MDDGGSSNDTLFGNAVKREAENIIHHLYAKHQDLAVATLALHCAYIASLRALKDTVPPSTMDIFLEMLKESDSQELRSSDKKVGIA